MKINTTLGVSLLTLITAGLLSFTEPPAAKFKVDPNASSLHWTGKKVSGQHTGTVQLSSGDLSVEGKTIKQGTFEVDLTTLVVTDIKDQGSNAKLVAHLKNEDFFNVKQYPTATFSIASVTQKTGDQYYVKGTLTIKGITNEIEFPAVIKNDGKKLTATATILVDRTKYNIRYGSASFFSNLGNKAINNEFELELSLVANITSGV